MVAVFTDGHILVPFGSYAGQNSGIPIEPLTTPAFRTSADALFGFTGTEKQARTAPGWLTVDQAAPLVAFAEQVANAYQAALDAADAGTASGTSADTADVNPLNPDADPSATPAATSI